MGPDHPPPTRAAAYGAMGLHVACAAGTYVLGKPAAVGFPDPLALTLLRGVLASSICLALTGWLVPRPRFTGREWLEIAGLGILLVPLNQYLFLKGLHDTVPAHPPLIYAMTPAGVMLLGAALERRRPPWAWLAGTGVALSGVVLVLEPWKDEEALRDVRRGDIAIFLGLLVWIVYTVWAKRLTRRHDSRTVTVWTLATGTAATIPIAALPVMRTDFASASLRAWIGLVWLGAVTSALMMFTWNWLLRRLEPVQASICANAQPAATAALAAALVSLGWLEGEQRLGTAYWAGTALVVAGVVLVQSRAPRAKES
jgi:drug/metabolite transporter (DMT)-like permease